MRKAENLRITNSVVLILEFQTSSFIIRTGIGAFKTFRLCGLVCVFYFTSLDRFPSSRYVLCRREKQSGTSLEVRRTGRKLMGNPV